MKITRMPIRAARNIDAMMPIQQFKERMDKMIRGIKKSPKAEGAERIYLPGEMEWEKYDEALKRGILLPPETIANLSALERHDHPLRSLAANLELVQVTKRYGSTTAVDAIRTMELIDATYAAAGLPIRQPTVPDDGADD